MNRHRIKALAPLKKSRGWQRISDGPLAALIVAVLLASHSPPVPAEVGGTVEDFSKHDFREVRWTRDREDSYWFDVAAVSRGEKVEIGAWSFQAPDGVNSPLWYVTLWADLETHRIRQQTLVFRDPHDPGSIFGQLMAVAVGMAWKELALEATGNRADAHDFFVSGLMAAQDRGTRRVAEIAGFAFTMELTQGVWLASITPAGAKPIAPPEYVVEIVRTLQR